MQRLVYFTCILAACGIKLTKTDDLEKFIFSQRQSVCNEPKMALLYANWCPHCMTFKATWEVFEKVMNGTVSFDCADPSRGISVSDPCRKFVKSYPKILLSVPSHCAVHGLVKLGGFNDSTIYEVPADGSQQEFISKMLKVLKSNELLSPEVMSSRKNVDSGVDLSGYHPQTRWSEKDLEINPKSRLDDATVGILSIIGSWPQGETLTPLKSRSLREFIILVASVWPHKTDDVPRLMTLATWLEHNQNAKLDQWFPLVKYLGGGKPKVDSKCRTDTCFIWTAFHLISAFQAAEAPKTNCIDDVTSISEANFCISPVKTLSIIHDTVYNLFDCAKCRIHFHELHEWLKPRYDVDGTNAVLMWLWQAHNAVNLRTAVDQTLFAINNSWRKKFVLL